MAETPTVSTPEPFSLKKLVTSPFTGLFWVKSIMYLFGISFLCMVGYAVYDAYFKEKKTQVQTIGNITVQAGGHLDLQESVTKEKKWPWYIPHPFVDLYVFTEDNDRDGYGARFGGHWEF